MHFLKASPENTLNVHFTKCHFIWKLACDFFFPPMGLMHKTNIVYSLNGGKKKSGMSGAVPLRCFQRIKYHFR